MLKIIRRSWRSLASDRTRLSVALALAFVGLLFWARLIVIADMPRTAIAEPDEPDQPAETVEPVTPPRMNDAVDDGADGSEAPGAANEDERSGASASTDAAGS